MFRDQAVHAYRRGAAMGSPLRIVPTWMVWSTRIIVLAVLVASAFAVLAKIGDYARGPAVIRVEGRQVIGSRSSGNVTAIEVQPGTRVEAGAVLLRLDDTTQQAELARVEREYDLLLARLLRDPRDMALRKQLASLDADKQLARARLDERTVIAETSGIVSDVRVRVGHHVNPGDALVAVDRIASAIVVVAMLPGHYRPRLGEDDTRLQLELEGFPKDRIDVTLRSMADEVVGPHEALRYLGKEQADAVELRGPVVVVEATVERSQFESDGELFRFYDGMQGSLEIEVDSDSIIESLLPAVDILGWLER
jgi:membrane fusion protein (multidrug efflux system)